MQSLRLDIGKDFKTIIGPILLAQVAIIANILFFRLTGVADFLYFFLIQALFINNPKILFSFLLTAFYSTYFYTVDLGFFAFQNDDFCVDTTNNLSNASLLVIGISSIKNRYFRFSSSPLSILLFVFAGYIIVDSLLVGMFADSRENVYRLLNFYLLFVLSYSVMLRIGSLVYLVKYSLYIAFLHVVVLILFVLFNSNTEQYYAGSYLLLILPILIGLFHYQKRNPQKIMPNWLLVVVIILCFYLMLLTNSRRYFIGAVLFISFLFIKDLIGRRILLVMIMIVGLGFLWLNGVFDALMPASIQERLSVTREALQFYSARGDFGQYAGDFYSSRDELYEYAYEIIEKNWVFGIGYLGSDAYIGSIIEKKVRIHNFFLQLFADNGIICLLLYFIILITMLRMLSRRVFSKEYDLFTRQIFTAFMVYVVISNIIGYLGLSLFYAKFEWFVYGIFFGAYEFTEITRKISAANALTLRASRLGKTHIPSRHTSLPEAN